MRLIDLHQIEILQRASHRIFIGFRAISKSSALNTNTCIGSLFYRSPPVCLSWRHIKSHALGIFQLPCTVSFVGMLRMPFSPKLLSLLTAFVEEIVGHVVLTFLHEFLQVFGFHRRCAGDRLMQLASQTTETHRQRQDFIFYTWLLRGDRDELAHIRVAEDP